MRPAFHIERPAARPSGRIGPWIEIAAWLVAFAVLLAAPCAPEPPGGAARASDLHATNGAPRAGAQPR